jgi:acyl-CoA hydrolase
MSSTYKDKQGNLHSRIVPQFHGDIITSPRSQVYFVTTEYGIINLEGRSTWERAEDLVSIAHPDFRDDLIKEAQKQNIWRRSNKR